MRLEDHQREMRDVYLGGSVGGFVSGGLWLASATLATWSSRNQAVWALIIGGMFIFPVTMMALRLLGRRATASRGNPLNALAMQVAFTVPLAIPIIIVATRARPEWFYPGFLIIVGAHYLPFVTLYGQPVFYGVAAVMVGAGFVLPFLQPDAFTLGGWLGGVMLVVTGVVLGALHARELAARPRPAHSP